MTNLKEAKKKITITITFEVLATDSTKAEEMLHEELTALENRNIYLKAIKSNVIKVYAFKQRK